MTHFGGVPPLSVRAALLRTLATEHEICPGEGPIYGFEGGGPRGSVLRWGEQSENIICVLVVSVGKDRVRHDI